MGGERNICLMNHFVPELFIIGGIKTNTTFLCTQLRGSPSIHFRKDQEKWYGKPRYPAAWKEGHFFDDHEADGIGYMIHSFPKCRHDVREVTAEGSARYSTDLIVPRTISKWYGDMKNRLTFV